ncbi:DUF1206 domain-containing protein [Nocardia sp. CDC159]|uniref:DUF1206 domain-containing protein n=1 Tax=Nocardia pulmonis TaxID=2951408 RepID=A0A9X2E321_9NOCA|nr:MULTISPECIES: DUF1206 domain-containing protein [Nocardia]MCM6771945.1 DUF1206 domain-containing protein [Nocardia pulmonis]MCM6785397.1 DUF1206 domain-containing protein [Nocardia sp. CDC159]
MSVLSGGGSTSGAASRVAQNSVLERFARAGFVMTGIVHLIIGYIAIRIALGGAGGTADQAGAMAELAARPGGRIALWAGVVAFVAMALWRLAEAVFGSASKPDRDDPKREAFRRVKALALAAIYAAFALSAFGFARGSGRSSGGESAGLTARLMQHTAGTIALVVAGLVIVAVGGYHVYKGATGKFLDDLRGPTGTWVRRIGVGGYLAKGLAVGAVGILVILAVTRSEPDKAGGLDAALKTLGAQPYGVVLLIVAGLGIIVYGIHCFVMARFAKM